MKKYHIYIETTEWDNQSQPNHVYVFLEKPTGRTANCMGYVPAGSKELVRFRNPFTFDLRGRTFVPLQ